MSIENSKSTGKRTIEETEENEVLTFQELIDQEKELDSRASAVLGASDETNCSYDNGYVYRQALYCCITCLKEKQSTCTNELEALHGICLACSYECHEGHQLYELYTKRYFRCDCGNNKFNINGKIQPCKFRADKEDKENVNSLNSYNHNFKGLYCTCNRPYPEEGNNSSGTLSPSKGTSSNEAVVEENSDEMHQCTICEDWFHSNHLEGYEEISNYDNENCELVCHLCMSKNEFLFEYQGYIVKKIESKNVDQNGEDGSDLDIINKSHDKEVQDEKNLNPTQPACLLEKNKEKNKDLTCNSKTIGSCLFIDGWRSALCKCTKCLDIYKQNGIEFLIKPNDTIKHYEECGKIQDAKKKDEENKLINDEFSKLNRITQIELIHNVNDFKEELKEFLESFAQRGEVIRSENVNTFFEELRERKKRKLEENNSNNGGGYYCK